MQDFCQVLLIKGSIFVELLKSDGKRLMDTCFPIRDRLRFAV